MVNGRHESSGWRILIAGTGGQGVLTAARLLCDTFVELGHDVVSGQLHGMAQRGGSVQSSVMIDGGISPVIAGGRADVVLGLEPVETARALPLMSAHTLVYMNTTPVVPFVVGLGSVLSEGEVKYPEVPDLLAAIGVVTPHVVSFDATRMAVESGLITTLNMIMVGCLLGSGSLPCSAEAFWRAVSGSLPPRLKEANTSAFYRGVEMGAACRPCERTS